MFMCVSLALAAELCSYPEIASTVQHGCFVSGNNIQYSTLVHLYGGEKMHIYTIYMFIFVIWSTTTAVERKIEKSMYMAVWIMTCFAYYARTALDEISAVRSSIFHSTVDFITLRHFISMFFKLVVAMWTQTQVIICMI